MKKTTTTNDVREILSNGFTTKTAKKDLNDRLSRIWGATRREILTADQIWSLEVPSSCYQLTAKKIAKLPTSAQATAQEFADLYAAIKATEITAKSTQVDDTAVRELSPAEATTAGIDFIDRNGDRRGYCYCCGRVGFKLDKHGRLSRHGYSRPGYGYDVGGCLGTKRTPEATLDIAIKWHGEQILDLAALLLTDLDAFALKQARREAKSEHSHWNRGSMWARKSHADVLKSHRKGTAYKNGAWWAKRLTKQREQHIAELASLELVKAGI